MNRYLIPAAVLSVLLLGFIGTLAGSAAALPEKVASHFDFAGRADGWMARDSYLLLIGLMGIGLPLFIVGMCYVTRYLPDWMINLPNKDYWLGPGRREHTDDYVFTHSLWLAAIVLLHFSGMHVLTILANGRNPPSMPGTGLLVTTGVFLALLGFWIVTLARHFRKPAL